MQVIANANAKANKLLMCARVRLSKIVKQNSSEETSKQKHLPVKYLTNTKRKKNNNIKFVSSEQKQVQQYVSTVCTKEQKICKQSVTNISINLQVQCKWQVTSVQHWQ